MNEYSIAKLPQYASFLLNSCFFSALLLSSIKYILWYSKWNQMILNETELKWFSFKKHSLLAYSICYPYIVCEVMLIDENKLQYRCKIGTWEPMYDTYTVLDIYRWFLLDLFLQHGGIVMLYHPCAEPVLVHRLRKLLTGCFRKHIITPYTLLTQERVCLLLWKQYQYHLNYHYCAGKNTFTFRHIFSEP